MNLIEGITYNSESGKFDFNFREDDKEDIIKLKFGNKFAKKTTKNKISVYSGYEFDKSASDEKTRNEFRKTLKNLDSSKISNEDFYLFLQKAIMGFNKGYSDFSKIDLIVTPKSSSPLAFEIAKRIKAKLPNAILSKDTFVKNALENIKVDAEKYLSKAKDEKNLKKRQADLKTDWKRATADGTFKMKQVYFIRRNLYSNYLVFDNQTDRKIYNAVANGRVLIVDDIFTTGSSVVEMVRELSTYVPKEIIVYTLLKG